MKPVVSIRLLNRSGPLRRDRVAYVAAGLRVVGLQALVERASWADVELHLRDRVDEAPVARNQREVASWSGEAPPYDFVWCKFITGSSSTTCGSFDLSLVKALPR